MGEFKKFVDRGNVVDLAIGLIIGTAFGLMVKSLVDDIFTPILALAGGQGALAFSEKFSLLQHGKTAGKVYSSREEAKTDGAITLNWGSFIQSVINFLIVALVLFLFIQLFQRFRNAKKVEENEICLSCLEKVKKGASWCKHCTRPLRTVVDVQDGAMLGGSSHSLLSEHDMLTHRPISNPDKSKH